MKKLVIATLLFCFPLILCAIETKVYKVVIRADWKPYYFMNDKGKPDGYAVELFENIAEHMGIKYEYVIAQDFQETLQLIAENKADIIPNISIIAQRENILLFTQPTDDFFIKIYKRLESKDINVFKDIENKKIGLVENNVCTKLFANDLHTTNAKFYPNYKELISALLNKEIDVLCYPQPLIDLDDTLKDKIVALDKSLVEIKRGVGISKEDFELLPYFNDAITDLKLTGKLTKLHEKWFNKKNYIELTRNETILLVLSFFGVMFTSLIIGLYFISKKKWLMTQSMLQKEVQQRTKLLEVQNKRLEIVQKKLKKQLNKDTLTKIFNRKFYNEKIEELVFEYKRYDHTFSFLIFDIDNFKNINDTYGHNMGDKVLIALTRLVQKQLRITDYFFRVGGEEFIVLLTNTNLKDALQVAQKVRMEVANKLNTIENQTITISLGLTQVNQNDDSETICKRADKLLYEAKDNGKNQVIFE